jgi:hypothetical protein
VNFRPLPDFPIPADRPLRVVLCGDAPAATVVEALEFLSEHARVGTVVVTAGTELAVGFGRWRTTTAVDLVDRPSLLATSRDLQLHADRMLAGGADLIVVFEDERYSARDVAVAASLKNIPRWEPYQLTRETKPFEPWSRYNRARGGRRRR